MQSERKHAAYRALDAAVRDLTDAVAEADGVGEQPEVVTTWIVVAGTQYIDDDGDRCGNVVLLPQDGSQPYYITVGILQAAIQHILS